MNAAALERLKEVRTFLTESKWIQGSYRKPLPEGGEGYCLSGAIRYAPSSIACVPDFAFDVCPKCQNDEVVRKSLGTIISDQIHVWNDRAGRTKDEVLKLLDKAIQEGVSP